MTNLKKDTKIVRLDFYFSVSMKVVNPFGNVLNGCKILDSSLCEWGFHSHDLFQKSSLYQFREYQ
jgi:hypothetical protein